MKPNEPDEQDKKNNVRNGKAIHLKSSFPKRDEHDYEKWVSNVNTKFRDDCVFEEEFSLLSGV